MSKSTWLIIPKTNLHVGNECSTGYGLIDKSVQRDALTGLPCINSSSLKGAINEYCCSKDKNEILAADLRSKVFGSDKKDKNFESKKGNTLFFDAHILFLPVQDDTTLFKLAYSDEVITKFHEKSELFGQAITKEKILKEFTNTKMESGEKFTQLCSDDELPIIARNVLENGESKNLWYEQVIPSETVFYTFLDTPCAEFENALNGAIVQIGANATIGYGYCKFIKL